MENKINININGREAFSKIFVLLLFLATTACENEGFKAATIENIPPGQVVQKGIMSDEEKKVVEEIRQELIMVQEELALKNRAITEGQVKLVQLHGKIACIQNHIKATEKGIDCSGFEADSKELESLIEELDGTRKQLNEEISENSKRARAFAEKLNDLILNLGNYATSEDVEILKNQLEEQSKFLDEQVNTITTSIVDLEVHKANLSEKLEALNASGSGTQEKREQLESEIENLQNQLDELNSMEEELKRISLRIRCMEPQRTDICETLSQNDPNANQGGDTDPAIGGESSGQGTSLSNHTQGSPAYAAKAPEVSSSNHTQGSPAYAAKKAPEVSSSNYTQGSPAYAAKKAQEVSSSNYTQGSPAYAAKKAPEVSLSNHTQGSPAYAAKKAPEVSSSNYTQGSPAYAAKKAPEVSLSNHTQGSPAYAAKKAQEVSSSNHTQGSPVYAAKKAPEVSSSNYTQGSPAYAAKKAPEVSSSNYTQGSPAYAAKKAQEVSLSNHTQGSPVYAAKKAPEVSSSNRTQDSPVYAAKKAPEVSLSDHTQGSPAYAGNSGVGISGTASQGAADPVEFELLSPLPKKKYLL